MDLKQINSAIKQIALEKGLNEDDIADILNTALAAAYRKDFGNKNQNITFKMNLDSGETEVWDTKKVVNFEDEVLAGIKENGLEKKYVHGLTQEEGSLEGMSEDQIARREEEAERAMETLPEDAIKYNPKTDILLEEAVKINKKYKIGDEVVTKLEIPSDFGRMAAQTAKQVIIQKLREKERQNIFAEFEDKAGELINAFVSRKEGRNILIELGKATAIMPPDHQVRGERYNTGDRIKVYVVSVGQTIKGPEIIVSRTHPQLIAKLFENEIPEVSNGSIEIKSVAREAGMRTKVAVFSHDESIDPIGSCVGQRGSRIQTIISELNGEKIDIIEYEEDPAKFISHSLSPAKVSAVVVVKEKTEKEPGEVTVTVPEDQLSLAIGREGQNVRLAAKLTGWKINILKQGENKPIVTSTEDEVIMPKSDLEEAIVTEKDEDIAKDLEEKTHGVVEGSEGASIKSDSDVSKE